MRLAITYNVKKNGVSLEGLPEDHYAEWDDMETIESISRALGAEHKEVSLVEADEEAYLKLKELRPDMVFNIAEGLSGESRESHIPSMLEMLGIPYTGSSPLALALCLNKARAKEVLIQNSVLTPRFAVVDDGSLNERVADLGFPLIVKPLFEGSSKGIRNDSVVCNEADLAARVASVIEKYSQPAIVEEYVDGREFTTALLGNGSSLKVLPVVEINYSALPEGLKHIYSYEAKWILDRPEAPLDIFTCPAVMDETLSVAIVATAKKAFNALGVRDWCRIDIRLDSGGVPYVLELNPLPGILPDPSQNSCFPKAARAEGMDFTELLNTVVAIARERNSI